jgi:hypothetical protein
LVDTELRRLAEEFATERMECLTKDVRLGEKEKKPEFRKNDRKSAVDLPIY